MGKQEIFISWSGERSKLVAEHLQFWLRRVIPTLKPFISTKDVEKGTFWFTEIKDKLSETNLGIICLTAKNKDKPWILYEAGALSKGLSISRVCTLLIDIEPKDITDPLARFNHTTLEKESLFQLVTTINNSIDSKIDDEVLRDIYNNFWDIFNNKCQEILDVTKSDNTQDTRRNNDEIIADILNITRAMDKKIDLLSNDKEILCTNWEPSSKIIQFEVTTINRHSTLGQITTLTENYNSQIFLGINERTKSDNKNLIVVTFRIKNTDFMEDLIEVLTNDFKNFDGVISVNLVEITI